MQGLTRYTIHIETSLVQCRSNLSTGRGALRRDPYAATFDPIYSGPKCPKDSPACGAPKPYAANILPPAAGPGTLMPQTLAQNPLMPGSFGGYPPPPGEVLVTALEKYIVLNQPFSEDIDLLPGFSRLRRASKSTLEIQSASRD